MLSSTGYVVLLFPSYPLENPVSSTCSGVFIKMDRVNNDGNDGVEDKARRNPGLEGST